MKIETQPREDHQVQLIADLEAEELEKYKRRAAREISKQTKIPGFRPGKAPYDVVRRHYGDEAIQQQAVELMVDDIYPKLLEEAEINPSGPGQLEEIISIDPPKFSFIVPLPPEVELPDYRAIRKDYLQPEITDEDIDEVLSNLRKNYATAEPVERPVESGDMVYIKLSAEFVEPPEGQEKEFIRETPLQVVVGEENPETGDWPYKGFSNELIGLSAEEGKDVQYTYPEDSPYEKLRNTEVVFHAVVQSVKSRVLPDLDDEFAKTLGDFETMEALREVIREQLVENRTNEYDDTYLNEILNQIIDEATLKYPPHMVEHEIEHVLEHLEQDLAQQRMDLETYLKTREMDRETFIDTEAKPIATRRLERSLVLEELAQKEEIRLKEGELENAVVQRMMELQQTPGFDPEQYKTKTSQRELTNAVAYDTANMLLNQHLFARLKEIARGDLEAAEKAAAEAPAAESQPETTEEPQAAVEVDEPVESEASAPQAEPANEEETPAAETPEKPENE